MRKASYICDRCGKSKEDHIEVDFPMSDKVVKDVGWITINSRSGYTRNVDLCEDCMKDLVRWFKDES